MAMNRICLLVFWSIGSTSNDIKYSLNLFRFANLLPTLRISTNTLIPSTVTFNANVQPRIHESFTVM
ncbi:hypothetical protein M378DRAFT_164846 [Amanita muscaria Koide BX008]|uniref:Secreted protein n=1 Tax=Amanita muscaria (strain Koide BX008) TaxID=946122 RepID=A0A0C2SIX7_AMAMK|nr:hypothetical protein M378DRAFT_164846 [Amanita muscaria Koide BX008]